LHKQESVPRTVIQHESAEACFERSWGVTPDMVGESVAAESNRVEQRSEGAS
jgi:hypothetical protein